MSLGEKSKLLISSDYGYGSQGAGGVIPPDADLVFEVELLAIGALEAETEGGGCCVIS
jgi:FK506-binding protein 1